MLRLFLRKPVSARPVTDVSQLLKLIVSSSTSVVQELSLDTALEDFNTFPSYARILAYLQPIKALLPNNPRTDERLEAASKVLAQHINSRIHPLRPLLENYALLKTNCDTLKTGVRASIDWKQEGEALCAKAAPLSRNARAIYYRLFGFRVITVLILAGEAGMIVATWRTLLGDEETTELIAISMAIATLGINELTLRLGFAPLYERLANRILSKEAPVQQSPLAAPLPTEETVNVVLTAPVANPETAPIAPVPLNTPATDEPRSAVAPVSANTAPIPTLPLWKRVLNSVHTSSWTLPISVALFQLFVNYAIVLLRGEFVARKIEFVFLLNSVGALTILTALTHILFSRISSLYPQARDMRAQAAAIRDGGRHLPTEIRRNKRLEWKAKPFQKRAARIGKGFQQAQSRICQNLERDPKLYEIAALFASLLTTPAPDITSEVAVQPAPIQSIPTTTSVETTIPSSIADTSVVPPPVTHKNGHTSSHPSSKRPLPRDRPSNPPHNSSSSASPGPQTFSSQADTSSETSVLLSTDPEKGLSTNGSKGASA